MYSVQALLVEGRNIDPKQSDTFGERADPFIILQELFKTAIDAWILSLLSQPNVRLPILQKQISDGTENQTLTQSAGPGGAFDRHNVEHRGAAAERRGRHGELLSSCCWI